MLEIHQVPVRVVILLGQKGGGRGDVNVMVIINYSDRMIHCAHIYMGVRDLFILTLYAYLY